MFHAAGLSDPVTHRTVALVAPSGTGKTTAVATLGQQFGYVTDETVIIDPQTLAITPFPKPLSVLGPSGQRPKALFSPDELGLLSTPMQPYLGAVVILARDPDHHDHPHLERLPLADALGHLLPQSSSLAALDRGLLDLARVLDQVGGCHILRYREIETVGPLLKNLLAAPPQAHTPNWAAVNLPTSDESAQQPADSADLAQSVIRRAPADDALLLPNHCLAVLSGTSFMLLQGLGPVIWETLVVPMPLDALVAQMVQQPHAPEDAEQVVRTAVDHLVERGVLIRSSGQ